LLDDVVGMAVPNTSIVELEERPGRSFLSELKVAVRGGAKVIALGRLPDAETAAVACQVAGKERLVLAGCTAQDAVGALGGLVNLGTPTALVAGATVAVLNQRLVRKLCSRCKVAYKPNPTVLRQANLPADRVENFYRAPAANEPGAACEHCGGTGYKGVTAIFELLVLNDAIRKLVREKAAPDLIRQEAVKAGMRPLQTEGLRQVVDGRVSIEELIRVCG
jgi:type II secretory ATPase GspE/PulE/Tfp pilus assembly ATPase PilB-like protein